MADDTQISEREREILLLVATGATNQQIAQQLNISVNTVKVHLRNIFGKIGVVSRTEATLYAVRAGLISVGRAADPVAVADEPEPSEVEPLAPSAGPAVAEPLPAPGPELVEPAEPAFEPVAPLAEPLPERRPEPVAPLAEPPAPVIAVPALAEPVAPPAPSPAPSRLPLLLGFATIAGVAAVVMAILLLRPAPVSPPAPTANAALPTVGERWRPLAPLPAPRAAFALAGAAFGGRQFLYAIGGDDGAVVSGETLRYDIAGDRWAAFRAKPTPVADVQAAVVGSRIFVPGGRAADGTISDALEAYDPQRDSWATLASLPEPRSRYALAAVEGKIYLFGGWDGREFRSEVFQYSPDSDSWAAMTAMPAARADARGAVVQGQVYVLGGADESGPLTVNQRYTPSEEGAGNPWSIGAPLPGPRARAAASTSNALVFVVGGEGSDGLLTYNADQDAWTTAPIPDSIPLAGVTDLQAQAVGGQLLLIFGGRGDEAPTDQAYEYQALFIIQFPAN